jgi:PadR family transcriptional regulator PadR
MVKDLNFEPVEHVWLCWISIYSAMRTTRLGLGTITLLQALEGGRRFGFDLMDATGLTSGTVYPSLERLEELGYVRSKWENESVAHRDGRPARRYFEITAAGSRALVQALDRYPLMRAQARSQGQ